MATGSEKYVIASIAKTHRVWEEMLANFQKNKLCIILCSLTFTSLILMNVRTIGVWPGGVRNMSLHPLQKHIKYKGKLPRIFNF